MKSNCWLLGVKAVGCGDAPAGEQAYMYMEYSNSIIYTMCYRKIKTM